jgi:molybdenum cofactor biosynthesis protein B
MSEPPSDSSRQHHAAAARFASLGFAVVTLSDTRTEATDSSGRLIREALVADGHRVVRYAIVTDDPQQIRHAVEPALDDPAVDVIITNGGTGLAMRDNAFEAITALLDKRIDGFGELFRMLSYDQVGAAAMLSRAVAGIARGKVVFSLPGSTKAVQLALEKLILPETRHIHSELHK